MTITSEQAAYIAGLFDGEGSIYYVRKTREEKETQRVMGTEHQTQKY